MSNPENEVQADIDADEQIPTPELEESTESPAEYPDEQPEETSLKTKDGVPDGVQKRIDRLTANARMALEQKQALEAQSAARIRALEAQLQHMQAQRGEVYAPATPNNNQAYAQSNANTNEPQRPNRAHYSDPADYADAMFAYQDAKVNYDTRVSKAQQEQQNFSNYINNLDQQHSNRIQSAKTRYEDFDEVSDNLTLDQSIVGHPNFSTIALTVMESDKSADLQYYLANNKAEARRILNLAPHKAALEIGRLEGQLKIAMPKISKGTLAPTSVKSDPSGARKEAPIEDARKRAIILQRGTK